MFWAVADRDHQPAGTDPRHRAPTSYAQAPRTRPRHRRPDDAGHGADGLVAAHPAAPGPDDADAVGVDRGGAAAGLPPGAVVLGRDRARDADRVAVAGDPDLSAAVRPGLEHCPTRRAPRAGLRRAGRAGRVPPGIANGVAVTSQALSVTAEIGRAHV